MSKHVFKFVLVALLGIGVTSILRTSSDEFTLDTSCVKTDEGESGVRRYTCVRDDLLELLAEVMESTVCYIEHSVDVQLGGAANVSLVDDTGLLIKTLSQLQGEICSLVRKIGEGVSGMSCKRLKMLEKRFIAIKAVLKRYEVSVLQEKLEKAGKNDQDDRAKLRENIKQMIEDLRLS